MARVSFFRDKKNGWTPEEQTLGAFREVLRASLAKLDAASGDELKIDDLEAVAGALVDLDDLPPSSWMTVAVPFAVVGRWSSGEKRSRPWSGHFKRRQAEEVRDLLNTRNKKRGWDGEEFEVQEGVVVHAGDVVRPGADVAAWVEGLGS